MQIEFICILLQTPCRSFRNLKYLGSKLKFRDTVTTLLIQALEEYTYASFSYYARNTLLKSTPMIQYIL